MARNALMGIIVSACCAVSALAGEISIAVGGIEVPIVREAVAIWEQKTGNKAKVVEAPVSSTDMLAFFQQQLAAGASDLDIYEIDCVWPGLLGSHLIDLTPYLNGIEKKHFTPIVDNDRVGDKLVALPWYAETGLFYYRKDLLEKYNRPVPKTWEEMAETAKIIMDGERKAGNDKMWGYVWQGKAYEGLTCSALEMIDSYGGGTILNEKGEPTVNNPQAIKALDMAASWVGAITPPGVLNYAEEEARGVFQSGNAVFMRNWNYAWGLANAEDSLIKGKVGVGPILMGTGPGAKPTACLGGWQLGISKYSKNPELAADLLKFLTSYDELKRRALKMGWNPTLVEIYQDPEVTAKNPYAVEDSLANAVARPSRMTGSKYNQVSSEFYNAVHSVYSGKKKAAVAMKDLEGSLRRLGRGGWK